MKTDKETIQRLAELAGLTVDASDIDGMIQDIRRILLFAGKLPSMTGDDSLQEIREPAAGVPDDENAILEAPVDPSFTSLRRDANGFVRVPRVFDRDSNNHDNTEL